MKAFYVSVFGPQVIVLFWWVLETLGSETQPEEV